MSLDDAKNQLKNTFEDETEDYIKAFSEAYPDNTPQILVVLIGYFDLKLEYVLILFMVGKWLILTCICLCGNSQ